MEIKDKVSRYTSECVKDENDQSKAYLPSQCNEEDVTLAGFNISSYFYRTMLTDGVTYQKLLAKDDRFNLLFALCCCNDNDSFFRHLLMKSNTGALIELCSSVMKTFFLSWANQAIATSAMVFMTAYYRNSHRIIQNPFNIYLMRLK